MILAARGVVINRTAGLLNRVFFSPLASIYMLALLGLAGCGAGPEIIKITGSTMGTSYHITLVADQPAPADLTERIEATLKGVDQAMSTYKADSQLSQFNRMEVADKQLISPDFADVLSISQTVWQNSGGAFDPTVGPLVDLWGFGPIATDNIIPSDDSIFAELDKIGFQYLVLTGLQLTKTRAVRIDLSAVAKGYAVDLLADLLESLALPDYLVEVGGEMRLSGSNPDGDPWRVAIEMPSLLSQVQRIISVRDIAVATSGDYRNYFEKQGVRYSHTIDPRTGRPIVHNLVSVTVLADSCAEADAWATAFMVMGESQGLRLAERLGIAVYMLVKQADGFRVASSTAFSPYLTSSSDLEQEI